MGDYEKMGNHLMLVDERNTDFVSDKVLGINIDKYFMPSVANVIGTDLSRYKLLRKGLFACNPMHVGRDERLPVALYDDDAPALVSPAYFMFQITDKQRLNDEYLMMWFRRPEFDRQCWLKTDGSVRGGITWDDICRLEVPVIPYAEQIRIVKNYRIIEDRIRLKRAINDNLAAYTNIYLQEFIANCTSKNVVKLKDLSTMQYGYTETATFNPVGSKFLRITDVAKPSLDWESVPYCPISESEHEKYVLREGDILVARTGATVGTAKMMGKYIPDAVFASFLVRICALDSDLDYYLGLLITSKEFLQFVQNNAGGSAQPQANPPLLGEFPVLFPDKIALNKFNSTVIPFLRMIENNEMEISNLEKLKNTIISMISRR